MSREEWLVFALDWWWRIALIGLGFYLFWLTGRERKDRPMFNFNFWPFKRKPPAPPALPEKTFEVVYEGTGGAGGGGGASVSGGYIISTVVIGSDVCGPSGGGGFAAGYSGYSRSMPFAFDLPGDRHRRQVRNFHSRAKAARAKKPMPIRKRAT